MVAEANPNDIRGLLEEIHSHLTTNDVRRPNKEEIQAQLTMDEVPNLQGVTKGRRIENLGLVDEYRGIVDETLKLVFSQHHRIISRLYPPAMILVSLEQLREGPLGEDLSRLAHIAMGAMRASREEVLGAIDAVLQLLFWPVGSDTYTVPRSFWEQPLGKLLSLAKLRSFDPGDLISIGNAANILNVTRPTIYRWMDDKSLDYVRDDMSGRTFVVRQDVEAMKADMEAAEILMSGNNEGEYPLMVDSELDEDSSNRLTSASADDIPVDQQLIALSRRLNKLVHDEVQAKSRKQDATTTPPDVARGDIAMQIIEEPLTSKTVSRTLLALTSLHTKLYLTQEGRFADLIDFTQTRDERFIAEANLVITRVSYNSPFSINIDPGKMGEALREGVDAIAQLDLRRKERKAHIAEMESNVRIQEEKAAADLADQKQERRTAREQAQVQLDRNRVALQRERSELLRYELEMVPLLMQTAMMMVSMRQPDITDNGTKELLARTYIPELLQLHGIEGLSRLLPAPKELPPTSPDMKSDPRRETS